LGELKQDITVLTETKKKGNGVVVLGPYFHFYSAVPKEKRAKRGISVLVKKRYKRYITTWEAINENMIVLHMNMFGKKLCILGIYAISDDENVLRKEDFLGKLNEVIDEIGNSRGILIAGDFNSRIGKKN
jgi:endonuclease/exonuclease/phosphatase (EEP) superfamily protein YafD